jgi:acyl carrier protein
MTYSYDDLRGAIARTLGEPLENIDGNAGPEILGSWDSECHMQVILEIESLFQIEFLSSELEQLTSVRQIWNILQAKRLGG